MDTFTPTSNKPSAMWQQKENHFRDLGYFVTTTPYGWNTLLFTLPRDECECALVGSAMQLCFCHMLGQQFAVEGSAADFKYARPRPFKVTTFKQEYHPIVHVLLLVGQSVNQKGLFVQPPC